MLLAWVSTFVVSFVCGACFCMWKFTPFEKIVKHAKFTFFKEAFLWDQHKFANNKDISAHVPRIISWCLYVHNQRVKKFTKCNKSNNNEKIFIGQESTTFRHFYKGSQPRDVVNVVHLVDSESSKELILSKHLKRRFEGACPTVRPYSALFRQEEFTPAGRVHWTKAPIV